MRTIIVLVLLLLAAPLATAHANDGVVPDDRVRPTVVQPAGAAEAPSQPSLLLEAVSASEYRAAASTAAAQEMPSRGSFWWLVGVIVVAGVVLALLLD